MTHTSKSRMGLHRVAQRIGGIVLALSTLVASAHALDPSTTDPAAIYDALIESNLPASSVARIKMSIKDKTGTRERVMSVRTKRYTDSMKALFLAEAPADVRDTAFLTVSYNETGRADEQWMYLPKLRRVTRIASSGKSDPLMGSDFSLSDLSISQQDRDNVELKIVDAAAKVGNEDCWILESVPRKASIKSEIGYSKMHLWVSKEKSALLQFKGWLVDGKRTKYFKASDLRSINGVWTAHRLTMRTLEGNALVSETLLEYLSVNNNESSGVSDSDFTQQRLAQGA